MAKSFLTFSPFLSKSGSTYVIDIYSSSRFKLRVIKWYAPWRRYVFYPTMSQYNEILFDAACLKEITAKIDALMDERKKK